MNKEVKNQKIASQMPYPENRALTKMVKEFLQRRREKALKEFERLEFLKRKKSQERAARVRLMFPKDEE